MLQGPQPATRTKPKKKQINTRTRAQTDYKKTQTQTQTQTGKQAQDDLLDLFGSFATDKASNDSNTNNSNPFCGDPFADFGFGDKESKSNTTEEPNQSTAKKKKKKKKKKGGRVRAQTVHTSAKQNMPSNNTNLKSTKSSTNGNNGNVKGQKPVVKMKKIDVLPLLHKGIRANKFKLNGNKSKVRTFYITESNFYFCWEAVGGQSEKKSLFGGKNKGQSNRSKIDKDRSIPIRAIRSLQKNPAYMMQSYSFIPSQQKALTLSVVYSANGQDKKLNFMSYEAFHNQVFYEGLQELIAAARDPKRNLNEVFELYVDFPKEILPKHLRPQRFKWEPLGDNDFIQQNNDNDNGSGNNMYLDSSNNSFQTMEVFDPTQAQFGRNRVKSF